ncbi:uncharacterized protein C1orf226 [Gadus macrocephalus]|uniref:uncharacterized protein C1orf226 n=1 Tax=Gadus macrocephalus TaxID=80720 RepID=UPI0028CB7C34|nr:uncharacterized protein C1orf226 [Gadus macrocephalus]
MFENSVAQHQINQSPRLGQPSARRATGPPQPTLDSSPSGGQQRLKNAINLGKAVGAKVNDLLRRKEQSHLGDIGVTEVNKNVGAVWSCLDQVNQSAVNSHDSSSSRAFDAFPRLDPPPPTGRKRLPRALKTTRDMMISSDPVVPAPDAPDPSPSPSPSSPLTAPDRTPLLSQEAEVEAGGGPGPGQGDQEEEGGGGGGGGREVRPEPEGELVDQQGAGEQLGGHPGVGGPARSPEAPGASDADPASALGSGPHPQGPPVWVPGGGQAGVRSLPRERALPDRHGGGAAAA